MKICICAILFSFSVVGGCSQSNYSLYESVEYFENGRMKASGFMYGGNKIGLWKYWHENGNLSKLGFHKLSEADMIEYQYDSLINNPVYKDVFIQEQIDTIDNQRVAVMNEYYAFSWYPSGLIQSMTRYDSSRSVTEYMEFYKNGHESLLLEFKDGMSNGSIRIWNEFGYLIESYNYINGLLDGDGTIWNSDGSIVTVMRYNQGLKDGVWKYYESGVVVREEIWKSGKLIQVTTPVSR